MPKQKLPGGLGRVVIPDERDKNFRMSSILPAAAPGKDYRYWYSRGWWGDQKNSPHCVGYAWVHWLEDGPVTHSIAPAPMFSPAKVYREAQKVDEWMGEAYEGTSVRAGAKILKAAGVIDSYYWTWDVQQLAQAILTRGPVVVGTNWYYSMFFPEPKTHIIRIGGFNAGGHAYLVNGVNLKKQLFRIKNSWGKGWGRNGHAYISFADMATLLKQQGECCLAVERKTEEGYAVPLVLK